MHSLYSAPSPCRYSLTSSFARALSRRTAPRLSYRKMCAAVFHPLQRLSGMNGSLYNDASRRRRTWVLARALAVPIFSAGRWITASWNAPCARKASASSAARSRGTRGCAASNSKPKGAIRKRAMPHLPHSQRIGGYASAPNAPSGSRRPTAATCVAIIDVHR